MDTAVFLNKLANNIGKSLIFDFNGKTINKGYHVTEFKASDVNSVDCGGNSNHWQEFTLHITAPVKTSPAKEYMSVEKFLDIYKKVATVAMSSTNINSIDKALIRVEYANTNGIAISYIVDTIEITEDSLIVKTLAPGTTCKATDYLTGVVPLATVVSDEFSCC